MKDPLLSLPLASLTAITYVLPPLVTVSVPVAVATPSKPATGVAGFAQMSLRIRRDSKSGRSGRWGQAAFFFWARVFFSAICTSSSNTLGSSMAIWLSILRLSMMPLRRRPLTKRL